MAMQKVNGGILIPYIPHPLWIRSGFNVLQLNDSNDKFAFIPTLTKTGTLRNVHFRTGTVTTGGTLKVSFQNLDATELPDGVIDQFRTVVVNSVDDGVWFRTGIMSSDGTDGGVKRAVTQGDRLAIVIEFDSGAGIINIVTIDQASERAEFGHVRFNESGTWAFQLMMAVMALEYDDGSFAYLHDALPWQTFGSNTVQNTSDPDEYALRFQVPFGMSIHGFKGKFGGKNVTVRLMQDDDTVLGTVEFDVAGTTATSSRQAFFPSDITIVKNTNYRLAWRPNGADSNIIYTYTLDSAGLRDIMALGTKLEGSTRKDAGAWTNSQTVLPMFALLANGFDDGAAGVGGRGGHFVRHAATSHIFP